MCIRDRVLYVLALSDHASESDFVSKLVGCFTSGQTDEQLIESVNSAFGTQLTVSYTHLDVYKRQIQINLFNILAMIAFAYCVIKIFFANIKRGGILLIQMAVGALYMLSLIHI